MVFNTLLATQPYDFWRDSIWQFIGAAIAVILGVPAIFLAIMSFRQQVRKKEISYGVISDVSIANINRDVKDRVEIYFDGKPVKDMSVVVLKVSNTGNVAVKPEDYNKPIKFEAARRTFVDANIVSTSPDNLLDSEEAKKILKVEPDNMVLEPLLLNPKEFVIIKLLVSGEGDKVQASSRIIEGAMREYNPSSRPSINTFLFIIIAILLLVYIYNFFTTKQAGENSAIIDILAACLSIVIFVAVSLATLDSISPHRVRKNKRKRR